MKRLLTVVVLAVAFAAVAGVAIASTREQPQLIPPGAPAGYLAINKQTCRFIHPEIDVKPTATERYARAEDARDDVKLQCLSHQGIQGYVRVVKSGHAHRYLTVNCPTGDVVLGGGSNGEVEASFPSSNTTWTISRDHRSPRVMTVFATCARS